MELSYKIWSLFLLLSLAQVSRAQLKCYICDNCPQVNANTQLLDCDEGFFNHGSNTEPSTQTTTDMSTGTTEMPTETPSTSSATTSGSTSTNSSTASPTTSNTTGSSTDSTSAVGSTTTEGATSESTTHIPLSTSTMATTTTKDDATPTTTQKSTASSDSSTTADITTTTNSPNTSAVTEGSIFTTNITGNAEITTTTEPQPPTPSTAHPSSLLPTPPNSEAGTPIDDSTRYNVNSTDSDRTNGTKPYIVSSEFRLRQTRAVSEYTYHCFKATASVNGSRVTSRGCSRVKSTESVCGQWKVQHPMEQNAKCYPCSSTRCNGSTALNLSLGAFALAVVAAFLQRK